MTKVPYGYEPGDLVNEAFEKPILKGLLHGKTHEEQYLILDDLIWKRTNHLATRVEQRYVTKFDDGATERENNIVDLTILRPDPTPTPEESLQAAEAYSRLLQYLKNKDHMFPHLAQLMFCGVTSSIEIGNNFGMSVQDVNNLKKRMKRAVKEYVTEHGGATQ